MKRIKVALIGYGYWGPKLLKSLLIHPRVEVKFICDCSSIQLNKAKKEYPGIKLVKDVKQIIYDKTFDSAILAIPTSLHFKIARQFVNAEKNVLVEKPMTETLAEGEELVKLASKKNVILCVDHPYVVSEPIKKIKSLLNKKYLGSLYYYRSERANLGRIDKSTNVFTDLVPHDLAILDYLLDKQEPEQIQTSGSFHILNNQIEDGNIFLRYKNGFVANIYLSWLSPLKVRHITIAGSKRILDYNDGYSYDKIRIFNSKISVNYTAKRNNIKIKYIQNKVTTPKLTFTYEPIYKVVDDFVKAVIYKKIPINNGYMGLRIVKTLERINQSIQNTN